MTLAFLALLGAPYIYDISSLRVKNPWIPPVIDPGTVRIVSKHLNQYATPGPFCSVRYLDKIRSNAVLKFSGQE